MLIALFWGHFLPTWSVDYLTPLYNYCEMSQVICNSRILQSAQDHRSLDTQQIALSLLEAKTETGLREILVSAVVHGQARHPEKFFSRQAELAKDLEKLNAELKNGNWKPTNVDRASLARRLDFAKIFLEQNR